MIDNFHKLKNLSHKITLLVKYRSKLTKNVGYDRTHKSNKLKRAI
jgi:hypothetical protein